MKINKNTILILVFSSATLIISLAYISKLHLSQSLKAIEMKNVDRVLNEVAQNMKNQVLSLESKATDWFAMNDANNFLERENINENEKSKFFSNLKLMKIDGIYFFDEKNQRVSENVINNEKTEGAIKRYFSPNSVFFNFTESLTKNSGFLKVDQTIFLFVIQPIPDSSDKKTLAGSVVFIKSFDNDTLDEFKELSAVKLNISVLDPAKDSIFINELIYQSHKSEYIEKNSNEFTINSKVVLKDYFSKPIANIIVKLDRNANFKKFN